MGAIAEERACELGGRADKVLSRSPAWPRAGGQGVGGVACQAEGARGRVVGMPMPAVAAARQLGLQDFGDAAASRGRARCAGAGGPFCTGNDSAHSSGAARRSPGR